MGETVRGPWDLCPCGQPGCTAGGFDDERARPLEDDDEPYGPDVWSDEPDPLFEAPLDVTAAVALAVTELVRSGSWGAGRALARAAGPGVVAAVEGRVLAALDRLWGLGWEPADVVRWAARRRLAWGDDPELVALALGASLVQRPQSGLPRRWRDQVAAHGLRLRVGPRGFLVEAGADQVGPGWARAEPCPQWAQVAARALLLAVGLERQQAMPTVGGPDVAGGPGGSASGTLPGGAPDGVDPKVLERVRLLLAKAESTAFPAEAETYTAAAQSLVTRHSLQAALAAADPGAGVGSGPGSVRVGVDGPYEGQKAALLAAVARANRCSAVWMRQLGSSTVVGFATDLVATELLFASLLTQAVRGMTAAGADARPGAHTRRPEFRRAYLESFARRIGQRLEEASRAPSATDGLADADGRLLPVLVARAAAVDDAVAQAFPELVSRRGPRTLDGAGWASGWAAAELASLDAGQAVTGTAALPGPAA